MFVGHSVPLIISVALCPVSRWCCSTTLKRFFWEITYIFFYTECKEIRALHKVWTLCLLSPNILHRFTLPITVGFAGSWTLVIHGWLYSGVNSENNAQTLNNCPYNPGTGTAAQKVNALPLFLIFQFMLHLIHSVTNVWTCVIWKVIICWFYIR